MMRCCRTGARGGGKPSTTFESVACLSFCDGSNLDAARGVMISTAIGSLLWSLPLLLHGLLSQ